MAELKLLGAGPVKQGVTQLAATFAKDTGHRVLVEFTAAPGVRERVLAGEAVDVTVAPEAAMDEFVQQGKAMASGRTRLGRSRMGIVIRKGAAPVDLSTQAAFERAVRAADAIVCNKASSGTYFVQLIEKLGLLSTGASNIVQLADTVKVMEHVADSAAHVLGVGQLSEIAELAAKGVGIELAGPLPDAIQNATAYEAAVTASSPNRVEAEALLRWLASPAALQVMQGTGID